jgi:hypothetical protein
MSLFDQTPRSSSRFGNLSSNMFFTRNTAKPKRVRHIEGNLNSCIRWVFIIYYIGLNGALICNVNDDPSLIQSTTSTSFDFTRPNLPAFNIPRRVERVVPPMGFWNTYGVSKFLLDEYCSFLKQNCTLSSRYRSLETRISIFSFS